MSISHPFVCSVLALITVFATQSAGVASNLIDSSQWRLMRPSLADAALDIVPAQGQPGGNTTAIRLTITNPASPAWHILTGHSLPADPPEGDILRMKFWACSPTGNPVRALVERSASPYTPVIESMLTLTSDWKEYEFTAISPGYGPGGVQVTFQAGYQAGVVYLAGVTVEDLGPDKKYMAQKASTEAALQPAAIQRRIRQYRMGDLTVVVKSANGRPVPGAQVNIAQTRHAFLFGANLFGLNTADTSATQAAYQQQFGGLLNYATLPFYWSSFEPQQGHPQFARLDGMVEWCKQHNITPKGHPLIWHEAYPKWAPADADAAIPLLQKRMTDIVTHYEGQIGYFDIVNEANAPDTSTGEGAWIIRDGAPSVIETALSWARAAGPSDKFIYNDYDTGPTNVGTLTAMQTAHTLPDMVGIQSHMHSGVWPMARVWQTCEKFARFGRPIHFTETTVISGPQRAYDYKGNNPDWNTTPEGEAAQADYVERFYTLLFSHPAVRAITWWDLSDRWAWLQAPAGLLRKDMSPKPAYTRLMELIHKTWWTNISGTTGRDGKLATRAFYGDYHITATTPKGASGEATLSWDEASGAMIVILAVH